MTDTEVTDTDAVARVARAADATGATIAIAESLTCGSVLDTLGRGEGASRWLRGGVVAYALDVKQEVLGLPEGIDPYSPECAQHLAAGVRRLLKADFAVATTGVGGPEPEEGHPPGEVYVGWASAQGVGHERRLLDGPPQQVLADTVARAVELLEELLRGGTGGGARKWPVTH